MRTRNVAHRAALGLFVLFLLAPTVGCPSPPAERGVPEDVIRLNVLGTAYLGQQKWAEAEESFRGALKLRPDDPLLLNNTAVALVQQGRLDEAEILLGEALALDPADPYANYNLGSILKNRGDFAPAAAHFEAVERFDPQDLMTHYNLGLVYSRIDREDQALEEYRRALELDPTHVSTLYALGRLLLQRGDQEEGVALITQSQEIRARSGLDEAVGSQYGEQGPYAMGVDYPGDALAAPPPIEVRFETAEPATAAAGRCQVPAGSTSPLASGGAGVYVIDGAGSVRGFGLGGLSDPILSATPGRQAVAVAAGDVDNDENVDLVAVTVTDEGHVPVVMRNTGVQGLGEASVAASATPGPRPDVADLTLVDFDHDGDLDLVWCWATVDAGGCSLGTNDGSGHFEVRSAADHGFEPALRAARALRVGFSDFDNDRDIDLLVASSTGLGVYANQRDGTFEDVSEQAGVQPPPPGLLGSMTIADVDKNGWMDLVVGTQDGPRFLLNRRGHFETGRTFEGAEGGAVVFDYDNDGFLDLVRSDEGALRLHRNLGAGEWDVEGTALASGAEAAAAPVAALDADEDGDLDLVTCAESDGSAEWMLLTNEGGNVNHWIQVDSRGVADNKFGVGAKVEVLAGALRQKFEIRGALPLHVGLGQRDSVESVRLLWPSGILQDEIKLPPDETASVVELDRKGTSCPLLYARGEDGWRFVTDFLGGSAVGYLHRPGVYGMPDTDEYVRIEGGIVPDPDGSLRLRINNQLQEVLWFDQAALLVVDHPRGTDVYPNERLMPGPPWPAFELFASRDVRPIVAARSVEDGTDLTGLLTRADRDYVRNFEHRPYKGYAEPHTIELDLGPFPRGERVVLLLDGWIDYADSSANLAAFQAGLHLDPPRLTVADGRGGWRDTGHRMGFPAGLPKTMSVDLTGLFLSDDHRLRIATNMRIYWDRARTMVGGSDVPLRVRRLEPVGAELRFGGFPDETSPDGRPPMAYDPVSVSPTAPWSAHVGSYTGFGDVRELLLRVDDAFVTTRNGDEIELRFLAPDGPEAGWTRTYLFFADGFGKDMDPNSAASLEVGPLPFHGMPSYPYPDDVVPPRRDAARGPGARRVSASPQGWPGAVPQPLLTLLRADGS